MPDFVPLSQTRSPGHAALAVHLPDLTPTPSRLTHSSSRPTTGLDAFQRLMKYFNPPSHKYFLPAAATLARNIGLLTGASMAWKGLMAAFTHDS